MPTCVSDRFQRSKKYYREMRGIHGARKILKNALAVGGTVGIGTLGYYIWNNTQVSTVLMVNYKYSTNWCGSCGSTNLFAL